MWIYFQISTSWYLSKYGISLNDEIKKFEATNGMENSNKYDAYADRQDILLKRNGELDEKQLKNYRK